MQKFTCGFFTLILGTAILLFPGEGWGQDSLKITVNGHILTSDSRPIVEDGRTLVPLRAVSEAIGAHIHFDGPTKTISLVKNSRVVKLTLNQKTAKINQEVLNLDVPAKTVNERTVVPLRFVGQALGALVEYNSKARQVEVTYSERRNNQTPEDYLKSLIERQRAQTSLEFRGTLDRVVDAPRQPGTPHKTFAIKNNFIGGVKGQKTHFKTTVNFPHLKGSDLQVETYYDGKIYYTKAPGVNQWQGNFDMNQSQTQIDPLKLLHHLESMGGIISFGSKIQWKNQEYQLLWIKIDPIKYNQQMKLIIDNLGNEITHSEKNSLKKLIDNTKGDMGYKLFIDPESELIRRVDFTFNYQTTSFGQTLGEKNTGTMEMFNYGQPVTMPKL